MTLPAIRSILLIKPTPESSSLCFSLWSRNLNSEPNFKSAGVLNRMNASETSTIVAATSPPNRPFFLISST
jgi:hypothetical protein